MSELTLTGILFALIVPGIGLLGLFLYLYLEKKK